jgi:hypothetical protein
MSAPGGTIEQNGTHRARPAQTVYCTKASSSGRRERARKIGVKGDAVAQATSAKHERVAGFQGLSAPPEAAAKRQ